MKKLISLFLIVSVFSSFVLQNLNSTNSQALAQTLGNVSCVNLSHNMTIGARDVTTQNEVSELQSFLNDTGFMNYPATGYFGVLTRVALAKYQTYKNIYPNVGYLGPVTRSAINQDTCSRDVPSNPSSNLTLYCSTNGLTYNNQSAYLNGCVTTVNTYTCSSNNQTYNNIKDYNNYCNSSQNPQVPQYPQPPQYPTIFYCATNGQNYYNQNDYNSYCRSTTTLPTCNLGSVYSSTNSCICPTSYTFTNVSNGFMCDNGNYACTTLYVDPWATSSTYDRCHYAYYCPADNLFHNNVAYCNSNNTNNNTNNNPNFHYCALNVENQGGGFVATNDCTCPLNSSKISTGNFGEIYKWICR